MTNRLARVVLTVRGGEGIGSAVSFYHEAIGLPVLRVTDEWAELVASPGMTLLLQAAKNEAQLGAAYSPWLTFEVDSMDERIARCVQMGAQLDGPIQYKTHGTVALLRAPCLHMVGLYAPATGPVQHTG